MAIVSPAPPARAAHGPAPRGGRVPCDRRGGAARARLLTGAGLALMLLAGLGLGWTAYGLPPGCRAAWWGINPLGPAHWAQHLRLALPSPLAPARWNAQFRLGIAVLWLGYGLLVLGARRAALPRTAALSRAHTLLLTAAFALALAVLMPPVLATDAYAYAASGRLAVLYGQNPYLALPYTVLHGHGDPAQFFLAWNTPTVYGPVWTGLSIALVAALPHGWLWGEVLGLKLIAAGALCLLAWSAGRVAEHWEPGRGRVAAVLVGLNPLLLLEGPGSGHNDLLMMACLVTALALFLEGRHGRAGLWLGLAVGIKLLPLALLPWLLWDLRRTVPDLRARRRAMLRLGLGMLLPLAAGCACFGHAGAVWDTLHRRTQAGHGTLLWAGLAWAALGVWQARQTRLRTPWLLAWAVFAAVFMLTGLGYAFPWYIAWVWPMLALRGGRTYRALFGLVFVFALVWESLYATLVPLAAFAR